MDQKVGPGFGPGFGPPKKGDPSHSYSTPPPRPGPPRIAFLRENLTFLAFFVQFWQKWQKRQKVTFPVFAKI